MSSFTATKAQTDLAKTSSKLLYLKSCSQCLLVLEHPTAVRKGKLLRYCARQTTYTVKNISAAYTLGKCLLLYQKIGIACRSAVCSGIPVYMRLPKPWASGSASCGERRLSNKTYCCQQFKSMYKELSNHILVPLGTQRTYIFLIPGTQNKPVPPEE